MPPYYKPTVSIKNRNTFFPQTEQLGDDEMRSPSWARTLGRPGSIRRAPASWSSWGMVPGCSSTSGSGCLRNIVAMQVPVPEINDIFITHHHVDH
jgi:ribonuclease Z